MPLEVQDRDQNLEALGAARVRRQDRGTGAANEGPPQDAVSRMGVGPPHTIEDVTEGDEVMEKRGPQDGITTEQAKGRTQR